MKRGFALLLLAFATSVSARHAVLNIAEVAGRPVHVRVTCHSDRLDGVSEREYELAPREQKVIEFSEELGAVDARIDVSGEGKVVLSTTSASVRDAFTVPFKAAPFQEPGTDLVYMRGRWYDPGTGAFLTPDPQGYDDSSTLYAYCGGDPINCTDPTGASASFSQSGWIIATDNRSGGRIVRFSPQQIATDPLAVRAFLGRHADVDARDADALIERAGLAWALSNQRLLSAGRRGVLMAGPAVDTTATGLHIMSSFTGVGAIAQITESLLDEGPTKKNVALAGVTAIGLGVTDDIVRLGLTESDSLAALARAGRSAEETPRLLKAGRTIRHHIFNKFRGASPASQKYRDFFAKHGIDVDRYSVEIPEVVHQKMIHASGKNWTTRWKEWIDLHPDATTKEVYQFAGQLMDEYGLSGFPIVPYR